MAKLKITVELEMDVLATTAELWGKQFDVEMPLEQIRLNTIKTVNKNSHVFERVFANLPPTCAIKSVEILEG